MATPPDFTTGAVLTAAQMSAVGLWLVKTQTVGTGVSSVTVTGAFSADYDNYKIVYTGGVGSTAPIAIALKMGTTTTGYYSSTIYFNYTSGGGTSAFGVSDNNAARWLYVGSASTTAAKLSTEVFAPFLTTRTTFGGPYNEFGTGNAGHTSGYVNDSTSYTSFTLEASTGTLTGGTIRVYGYRN
jgi:hypothetical protein